jgi:hypothetical protein
VDSSFERLHVLDTGVAVKKVSVSGNITKESIEFRIVDAVLKVQAGERRWSKGAGVNRPINQAGDVAGDTVEITVR